MDPSVPLREVLTRARARAFPEGSFSSSLLLSRLELSDANVYEPQTRARLGTEAHFCEASLSAGLKGPTVTRRILNPGD